MYYYKVESTIIKMTCNYLLDVNHYNDRIWIVSEDCFESKQGLIEFWITKVGLKPWHCHDSIVGFTSTTRSCFGQDVEMTEDSQR